MKILAAILLVVTCAAAQTNLGTITFTNRYGDVTSNAVVTKIEPDALVYSVPDGGGRVKFSELPDEIRTRFGYDPAKAAQAEQAEKQKQLRDSQILAAQAQTAAQMAAAQNSAQADSAKSMAFEDGYADGQKRGRGDGHMYNSLDRDYTTAEQLEKYSKSGLRFSKWNDAAQDVQDSYTSGYTKGYQAGFGKATNPAF